MANYGRGWNDGYGSQSKEASEKYDDEQALAEGDWEYLENSARQRCLRGEQGLHPDQFAEDN